MTAATLAPQQQELQRQASDWIALAKSLKIEDQPSYEHAAEQLLTVKKLQGEVNATFDPIIAKANAAHREAIAQKKKISEPLDSAESLIKCSIAIYLRDQQRKRAEEEQQLQQEAELLAAQLREAEIEQAEKAGADQEEIRAITEAPLRTAPVTLPRPVTRVPGITEREAWHAEVDNMEALVKFVAANPRFLTLLRPDQAAINKLASALRSTMHIPGIRVWSDASIAVRKMRA